MQKHETERGEKSSVERGILKIIWRAGVIGCNFRWCQGNIRATEEGNWTDRKEVREGNIYIEVTLFGNGKVQSCKRMAEINQI